MCTNRKVSLLKRELDGGETKRHEYTRHTQRDKITTQI